MPVEEPWPRAGAETLALRADEAGRPARPAHRRAPHAVVQLRQENREATLYNLVGFQTKLT